MNESHEFKVFKYEDLTSELHQSGYKTQMFTVEVGAHGMVGAIAYSLFKRLGLASKE